MSMFSTLTSRLLLGLYVFIILSIPVGAYFLSQSQTAKTSPKQQTATLPKTITTTKPTTSPARQLLDLSQVSGINSPALPTTDSSSSPEIAASFGPTLSFSSILEGRTKDNQATKMFVGIVEGILTANPKFLLSFTVDLPVSGAYSNLSLAGLNPGSTYTVLLKGSAQIATSSAFTMSPTVSNINEGQPLTLLSGDLNEDNMINSADYSIAQKIVGATPKSPSWNENIDLNKDGIINAFDLGIIAKNMSQIGASGTWTSPLLKTATASAGLSSSPVGGPPNNEAGHWIWVPDISTP